MRLKLISCELFKQEVRAASARSQNQVEFEFLPNDLHQLTQLELLHGLQNLLDAIDRSRFHAVLLVCGTCQRGLAGLQAKSAPLVLPRAPDCISLLISAGVSQRHSSPGPLPGSVRRVPDRSARASCQSGADASYWMAPVKKPSIELPAIGPGEQAWAWRSRFGRIPDPVLATRHPKRIRRPVTKMTSPAPRSGGPRDQLSLLRRLVDGYWSYQDFLVVPPGWQVAANPVDHFLRAEESIL